MNLDRRIVNAVQHFSRIATITTPDVTPYETGYNQALQDLRDILASYDKPRWRQMVDNFQYVKVSDPLQVILTHIINLHMYGPHTQALMIIIKVCEQYSPGAVTSADEHSGEATYSSWFLLKAFVEGTHLDDEPSQHDYSALADAAACWLHELTRDGEEDE